MRWERSAEGLISLELPKFQSRWIRGVLERIGMRASYRLLLDREGSVVWSLCDGKARVHDVIERSLHIVGEDEATWTPRVCHYLMLLVRRRCLSLDRT